MAALSVHLPPDPVDCNAWELLDGASAALARHGTIEAACYLREAVRHLLLAECTYHDCTPKEKRGVYCASPRALALALRRRGILKRGCFSWIIEVIDTSNKAAHLVLVHPRDLDACVAIVRALLESSPYLVHPKSGGQL